MSQLEIFDKDGQKITRKEHRAQFQEHLLATTYSREEIVRKGVLTARQLEQAVTAGQLKPIIFKKRYYYPKQEFHALISEEEK